MAAARLFVEALLPDASGEVLGLLLGQWRSAATQRALINTLESSLLATVLSVVIGATAAFVLTLTDMRGQGSADLRGAAAAAGALADHGAGLDRAHRRVGSPILGPLGLAPAPGTTNPLYSKWGIVLVMGIEKLDARVPGGARGAAQPAARPGRGGAARRRRHPLRVTRSVIMPLAMPAILAGAALAFVTSIGNFGIPAMLGIPGRYTVLTTLIYQRLQGFGPRVLGEVAALALILAALAVVGLLLRALIVRRGGFAAEARARRSSRSGSGAARVAGRSCCSGSCSLASRSCRCWRCSPRRSRPRSACRCGSIP